MKLLLIGIDGLDWNYLKQSDWELWKELPHKGKLMPEPDTWNSLSLWTTITTGVSKKEHGLCKRGWITNPWVLGSNFVEYKRLWEYLGYRSLIFSLVGTDPPHPLNGVMISGVTYPFSNIIAYPPEIYKEIQEKYNYLGYANFPNELREEADILKFILDREKTPALSLLKDSKKKQSFKENVLGSTKNGVEVVKYIDKKYGGFDFAIIYLRAIDDMLHVTGNKNEIQEVHELIFNLSEDLIDTFNPDNFIIISDHGMKMGEEPISHIHDMEAGVWGSTFDFELKDHFDVTPAVLKYYGMNFKPERVLTKIQIERSV